MAPRPKSNTAKSAPAQASVHAKKAVPKPLAGGKTTGKSAARTAGGVTSKPAARKSVTSSEPAGNRNGHHGIDTAAEQSAREVFETLTRWQGEVATAAEAMASTFSQDADEGTSRFASLLKGQREMLEQIKATLGQFQELLEACEKQLETQAKTSDHAAGEAKPIEMPLHALQSFQQIALSNIGVWTKIAQDAQGMWLGAMQIWVPKAKDAANEGSAAEEHN